MGASGSTTVDFGAFPGAYDASVTVTGQASIAADSEVGAWLRLDATADHTADEHMLEDIKIVAGNIVAGTGFTIYAFAMAPQNRPAQSLPPGWELRFTSATAVAWTQVNRKMDRGGVDLELEVKAPRVYGLWTVQWAWA